MTHSSRIDRLSEYIDTLNSGSRLQNSKDVQDMADLIDTIDQIKLLREIEMPSDDFIESVARKIKIMEEQKPLKKKWILPKWFLLAASIILVFGLLWQQFSHSFVKADQITVIKEKELIPLGQHEVENPSYIGNQPLISFGNEEKIWTFDPQSNKKTSFPLGSFLYMRSPAWSPDGKKVAFSGYKSRSAGIWIMDNNGANVQKVIVPNNINENYDKPVWSPDGKQIAFTRTVTKTKPTHGFTTTKQEIWIMNQDGTDAKKLTDGKEPSWSPDGKMLSFTKTTTKENAEEVWTINVNGSNAKKLTNGMESSWSPNGDFIVYSKYDKKTEKLSKLASIQTSFREIWAIHVKSHKYSQLTKGKVDEQQIAQWKKAVKTNPPKTKIQYVSSGNYSDWQPSWSKDGKSLLFSRDKHMENGDHFSLYKLDLQFN